jgi:hypothetical protein
MVGKQEVSDYSQIAITLSEGKRVSVLAKTGASPGGSAQTIAIVVVFALALLSIALAF